MASSTPLSQTYPINTIMELTLSDNTTLRGLIYCTDETSQSIVIKRSLVHTTLSSEMTVVHAATVKESKSIELPKTNGEENEGRSEENIRKYGVANMEEVQKLQSTLPHVSKKALEERERRALRMSEESFSHVNQKVS